MSGVFQGCRFVWDNEALAVGSVETDVEGLWLSVIQLKIGDVTVRRQC